MELRPAEFYIKEKVAANLFRGIEAVGGRLHITNERLIFKPHRINVQTKPLEINIKEIKNIKKTNTLLLVPNGMKVILDNGQEYRFVVGSRTKLIDLIMNTKNKLND
ncbi:GRAM domain-containing protein [Paenibacillus sp. CMAA1364]